MREADTYRGARRNAFREDGIDLWRNARFWNKANIDAKIEDRAKQCDRAVKALSFSMTQPGGTLRPAMTNALIKFWRGEPRTRVVNRILKELDPKRRKKIFA